MADTSTNSISEKLSYKVASIWTLATVGFTMMVSGLMRANNEEAETIMYFPRGETATGVPAQYDLTAQMGGPLIDGVALFLFFGGFLVVITAAYIDYNQE